MLPLSLGLVGGILTGSVGAVLLSRIICRGAWRWGLLDEPRSKRKLHARATPTGGGLAIAGGVGGGAAVLYGTVGFPLAMQAPLLWIGAFLMLGVGVWDDAYELDVKGKFLLQLVSAYLLLHAGSYVGVAGLPFAEGGAYNRALYSIPLTVIWVVGIINASNLIDGLDGLAGGVLGIAFLSCAVLFGVKGSLGLMGFGLVVAGALGGFLLYNFRPASLFMGDSGSLFLGYLLAAYTLQGPLHSDPLLALLIPPILLGVPVLDTTAAIARRLISHRSVFGPDTSHIHHRLLQKGSEKGAVLILYMVGAWFGSAAILMGVLPAAWGYAIAGATVAVALVWTWRLGCLRPVPAEQQLTSKDGQQLADPEREAYPEARLDVKTSASRRRKGAGVTIDSKILPRPQNGEAPSPDNPPGQVPEPSAPDRAPLIEEENSQK